MDLLQMRSSLDIVAGRPALRPPPSRVASSHFAAYNVQVRYLGVDPGGQKMGLAVGDDSTGVVAPLEVVGFKTQKAAARHIVETADRVGAVRIVIGLPALADGSVGPAGRRSELLAEAVRELGFEVVLQNEFLSTNEARRRARTVGRPRQKPVDDIAAQVILEEFLATHPAPQGD